MNFIQQEIGSSSYYKGYFIALVPLHYCCFYSNTLHLDVHSGYAPQTDFKNVRRRIMIVWRDI